MNFICMCQEETYDKVARTGTRAKFMITAIPRDFPHQ
jgi:hypothetical protein